MEKPVAVLAYFEKTEELQIVPVIGIVERQSALFENTHDRDGFCMGDLDVARTEKVNEIDDEVCKIVGAVGDVGNLAVIVLDAEVERTVTPAPVVHRRTSAVLVVDEQTGRCGRTDAHDAADICAHQRNDRFNLMDGIVGELTRTAGTDEINTFLICGLDFIGEAERGGREARRVVRFGNRKNLFCNLLGSRKGLVNVRTLAGRKRQLAQVRMLLGGVGREHNETVVFFDDLLDGGSMADAILFAPLFACHTGDRRCDLTVCGTDGNFTVRCVRKKLGVVIGMPFVEIIINKTDFHNDRFLS